MRSIVLFILISVCLSSNSQIKDNRSYSDYNFYDVNDTCIFQYTPTIVLTADTEKYFPKAFEIKLPKPVKHFESDYSQYFRFFLTDNQTIFVDTDLHDNKLYMSDTIYTSNIDELSNLTKYESRSSGQSKYFEISNKSKYFEKVEKIVISRQKKGTKKGREDIVLIRDKCKVLLFNIKSENIDIILRFAETFKRLPSSFD